MAVPTRHKAAPPRGNSGLSKPLPWTPLRPFILELSDHPDRVFVRQLIENLRQGCKIGYSGPQFTHLASNLESASQKPQVIDAILRDKCAAGQILSPYDRPPLPNFHTSGPNMMGDGGLFTIYQHPLQKC